MPVHFLNFNNEQKNGVTYEQAMDIFHRFCMEDISQAVPSIAHELNIPYEICCDVLEGKIWPEAHRIWVDRVLP